jgi:hypothetical protein
MIDDRVPINFPAEVVDTVAEWLDAGDGSVGACLRCGGRYYSQEDVDNHRCRQD